mmetsp:Transcript_109915/g.154131  ORF Transcript_109915/g.154131 Transcript_109915/m.154131 type:complete len:237 (-) Transcript_109915:96-806(-)
MWSGRSSLNSQKKLTACWGCDLLQRLGGACPKHAQGRARNRLPTGWMKCRLPTQTAKTRRHTTTSREFRSQGCGHRARSRRSGSRSPEAGTALCLTPWSGKMVCSYFPWKLVTMVGTASNCWKMVVGTALSIPASMRRAQRTSTLSVGLMTPGKIGAGRSGKQRPRRPLPDRTLSSACHWTTRVQSAGCHGRNFKWAYLFCRCGNFGCFELGNALPALIAKTRSTGMPPVVDGAPL